MRLDAKSVLLLSDSRHSSESRRRRVCQSAMLRRRLLAPAGRHHPSPSRLCIGPPPCAGPRHTRQRPGVLPAANLEREIEIRHTHTQAVQQGGRPEACDSYSKFVVLKKTKIYFCTGTSWYNCTAAFIWEPWCASTYPSKKPRVVRHHFRGAGIVIDFYFKTSSATTFSVWPLRKNL